VWTGWSLLAGILVGQDGRSLTLLIFGWGSRVGKRRLQKDVWRGAVCFLSQVFGRRMRWVGGEAHMRRNACRILVGKLEGKRSLGRSRR